MATGAPGTNGVWQYGEDDSEATFSALLNKAASTTDTQIGLDRARLTTLEAKPLAGLIPVAPTSVTNYGAGSSASYTSIGVVTFSTCTSVTINGVFTSAYKNYRIVISGFWNSTNAANNIRFSTSGTNNATSNYYYAGSYGTASGATGAVNGAGQDRIFLGSLDAGTGDDLSHMIIDVFNPQGSGRTAVQIKNISYVGSVGGFITYNHSGIFNAGGNFDGLSFIPSGGTIGTSTLQIFGYND